MTYPLRVARRRPWLFFLALALVFLGAALAGYAYVRYQWRAANEALAADRPEEARDRVGLCLLLWPRSLEVHLLAARACRRSNDASATENHLNQCLRLQGGASKEVQLEFLLLRAQTGEVDEVSPALIRCVEDGDPESPIILETLSRAYMHRLRYKPAYACLSRWIELCPDAVKAYQWRGWVLERLDQHKAAMLDYLQALQLDPDLFIARLRVAEMLLEDNRAPDAVPHLEQLHRQAPDRPEVLARLGMCRFHQGQTKEARQLMEAALPDLPNDPALLVNLAKLDIQEGRGADAEERLRHALRIDRSDVEARFNLVAALELQGRTEESAAALKEFKRYKTLVDRANKLLREGVDSPTAGAADYAEVGELLLRVGRDRLAVYWLEQALDRDPANQRAHRALAEYYENKGEAEKAAAHRRQLVRPGPKPAPDARSGAR